MGGQSGKTTFLPGPASVGHWLVLVYYCSLYSGKCPVCKSSSVTSDRVHPRASQVVIVILQQGKQLFYEGKTDFP